MTAQPDTLPQPLAAISAPLIGLLGPVDTVWGKPPSSRMVRQVLALLAWHANSLTTPARIMDELYGELPKYASQNVQTYVYNVRQHLPGIPVDTHKGGGYVLRMDPLSVDVHRFDHLIGAARCQWRDGTVHACDDTIRAAFSLSRGPMLEDVKHGPVLGGLVAGFEDRWRSALDLRHDVDLRLGRHRELVDELAALARQDPTREDTTKRLMLALYRSNRRVDALKAYQLLREELVSEYGVEPCTELRGLQQQVLRGDPALEWQGGVA